MGKTPIKRSLILLFKDLDIIVLKMMIRDDDDDDDDIFI